ncbi:adenosine deaminase-like [Diadema antillarum]|uniref:adenosine deaminase-like n=1 Tax=Diadema antillarum TaxID=105358 RepID=UPI003A86C057
MPATHFTDETFPKVELHVHLEGAIRPETIWDVSQKRGIRVAENDSLEELRSHLVDWSAGDLATFLHQFTHFMPCIAGSREVAKRISYEMCEDLSKQGVVYFEMRYAPHLLANSPGVEPVFQQAPGDVTPRDIVQAVNEGIHDGERDFGIQARSILCLLRERPEWSAEVLNLCKEFHNDTVVGIDLANNEAIPLYEEHVNAFKGALSAGIHRTCHAAEMGPAENVRTAVQKLYAERIGHGYQMLGHDDVIKLVKDKNIHVEVCPTSSTRTGAQETDFTMHSAHRFLKEGLNLSFNTDDPTLFGCTMTKEFGIARTHFGMNDVDLAKMTLNAARSCFLPDDQRDKLVIKLEDKFSDILKQ